MRDQCVPSGAVQSEICPWRDAPFEDVSVQTLASAGGLGRCGSARVSAIAGPARSMADRYRTLRIMEFPLDFRARFGPLHTKWTLSAPAARRDHTAASAAFGRTAAWTPAAACRGYDPC